MSDSDSVFPNSKLKKWELIKSEDVSPSVWMPIEKRVYRKSNGEVVDDFLVTTLADVAMIVPRTSEGDVIAVRQFKPGFGDVMIEFPAGRNEMGHKDIRETAVHELEEETGIKTDKLEHFATFSGFSTKATEKVFCYFAPDVDFNSAQRLDKNEEIEVLELSPLQFDELVFSNEIKAAVTVAAWIIARRKYFGL